MNSQEPLLRNLHILYPEYKFIMIAIVFGALDYVSKCRSSHPEVFLRKGVLKICSKFTGNYPCVLL